MFQLPAVVILSIAATRIYRALADFVSESTDMFDPPSTSTLFSPVLTVLYDSTAYSSVTLPVIT